MENYTDIAIIGAGPYGLSLASHLKYYNMEFRIFGSPMSFWLKNMPKGMELKSTGYSSTLYAPNNEYTIADYCEEKGIAYQDVGLPVKIETFCNYAIEFQHRYAPNIENEVLKSLTKKGDYFYLGFDSGMGVQARNVIVAVGLDAHKHIPAVFSGINKNLCLHSSELNDLSQFRGKKIAVIGGGSSAIDTAVLLFENGAEPTLISRKLILEWGEHENQNRTLLDRITKPMSGVGPGWKNRLTTDLIAIFPYLPKGLRQKIVNDFLGPAGGWFMKDRMTPVRHWGGCNIKNVQVNHGMVDLELSRQDGSYEKEQFDSVILGTGYKFDIDRLSFIDGSIRNGFRKIGRTPALGTNFESSLPGLYFIGPISATTFGPAMRFSLGAGFMADRLGKHLAKKRLKRFRNYPVKATSAAS